MNSPASPESLQQTSSRLSKKYRRACSLQTQPFAPHVTSPSLSTTRSSNSFPFGKKSTPAEISSLTSLPSPETRLACSDVQTILKTNYSTMTPTSAQTNSPDSPLTNSRHEAFAQLVANGGSEVEAYLEAYKCKSKKAARSNSSRLLANDYVRARVRFLKDENARMNALSRSEKRDILAALARNSELSPKDRISAIQEDNRMTGDAEEKINLSGSFNLNW